MQLMRDETSGNGMSLAHSVVFFGVPGATVFAALYLGVPIAAQYGVPLIVSWSVALWAPIMMVCAYVIWTGWPRGHHFRTAFWFRSMTGTTWLIVLAAVLALQVCEVFLAPTGAFLAQFAPFAPPTVIPELFDPNLDIAMGLETFLGVPVRGNWWLVAFWIGWLFVNIFGEELVWRGYALPRQEKIFGRYAWLVNGLCWNLLIHAFMRWNVLALMPVSLLIPFLVQRYKNTWIGIYIHGFGNLAVLALLIPSIAGWI
jgi:membrane protease YdiL (CAAX protease family)